MKSRVQSIFLSVDTPTTTFMLCRRRLTTFSRGTRQPYQTWQQRLPWHSPIALTITTRVISHLPQPRACSRLSQSGARWRARLACLSRRLPWVTWGPWSAMTTTAKCPVVPIPAARVSGAQYTAVRKIRRSNTLSARCTKTCRRSSCLTSTKRWQTVNSYASLLGLTAYFCSFYYLYLQSRREMQSQTRYSILEFVFMSFLFYFIQFWASLDASVASAAASLLLGAMWSTLHLFIVTFPIRSWPIFVPDLHLESIANFNENTKSTRSQCLSVVQDVLKMNRIPDRWDDDHWRLGDRCLVMRQRGEAAHCQGQPVEWFLTSGDLILCWWSIEIKLFGVWHDSPRQWNHGDKGAGWVISGSRNNAVAGESIYLTQPTPRCRLKVIISISVS